MSTPIRQGTPMAPPPVEDIPASGLHAGDVFLVEQHVVRCIRTGQREVLARVTHVSRTLDGLLIIDWAGAARGADNSTGTATYDSEQAVTRVAA